LGLGKPFKGFRFQPQLYADFMKIARSGGYTVTGAFEKFMSGYVEINALVFPDRKILDSEAEARVLADWLDKGKHFYRTDNGEEVNIQGRLLWLLPKINDSALKKDVEDVLKKSVSLQE
jgi:hypothetical protein